MTCNLQLFSYDKESYKIKGLFKFEEVNTLDTKQANRWTRNRRLAYQNSLRFLMKSIVDKHERENGFNLYLDNRPNKYVSTSGYFANELEKNLDVFTASNSLTPTGKPGLYKLVLDKRIEVHHTTQFARQKTYRDVTHPVSWIEVDDGFVILGHDGIMQSSEKIVTSGELNNYRTAGMLPLNYSPGSFVVVNYLTKRNHAKRLQERVFVQTDKTVYYPGERVWFKAHMNYANPSLRDSLSRVLYLDLINDVDSVLTTVKLKIDSLGATGNILLDSYWTSGRYRLRAYTRWMQNYGQDGVSLSEIFISPPDKRYIFDDDSLAIKSGEFKLEEQIAINDSLIYHVSLDSTILQDWASCAVSIAPVVAGLPNQAKALKENLYFSEDLPDGTLGDFTFPLEQNFSVLGKVEHSKKKASRLSMTVIKGFMDSLYTLKTDRNGMFKLTGFEFYDTVTFSFQARDKKGRIFGTTKLVSNPGPAISRVGETGQTRYNTVNLDVPVQLSKLSVDSVPMPLSKLSEFSLAKTFTNADYVLLEDDLKSMPDGLNIITALVGRIPGLQYNTTNRKLSFRNSQISTGPGMEPLIVLDGIPFYSAQGSKESERIQPQSSKQETSAATDNFQQSSPESATKGKT